MALLAGSGILPASVGAESEVAEGALLLPFDEGETWYVCRGYNHASHAGGYALDLTFGSACSADASANRPALSPWSGVVSHKWGSASAAVWEGICINLDGGGSFKIGHVAVDTSLVAGSRVVASQQVGTVHPAGVGDVGPTSHMHVEAYMTAGCDRSGERVPFSQDAQLQCAPDLAWGGAGGNGQWSGTPLTREIEADAKAGTPFWDICNNPFASDIRWTWEAGLTNGCAAELYCPREFVSREMMAAFLDRLYAYPEATRDYFADDEGSIFEDSINRLAEAGMTVGCVSFTETQAGRYCPTDLVTRAEMATFLSRTERLGPPLADHFSDDDGHLLEDGLNRAAEAGLLNGCDEREACPDLVVTREQMAAFLHRAAERIEIVERSETVPEVVAPGP